jgi:hypothetical protein
MAAVTSQNQSDPAIFFDAMPGFQRVFALKPTPNLDAAVGAVVPGAAVAGNSPQAGLRLQPFTQHFSNRYTRRSLLLAGEVL